MMDTLLDLLDDAFRRYADRPALGLWHDDGTTTTWTYAELDRRSRLAAWRLRKQLGLQPGDRILTWSPSEPALPAVYFGAMRAGLVLVPLDLRMAPDAIERVAARAEAQRLIIGTGRDAPDPREAGLAHFPTTRLDTLTADVDETFPADWEPPRMNQRQKFDIRITPLTAEEYAKPLLDIVNEHEKKLRDPQAEPKPKPPQAGVATHSRPAGTEP